MERLRICRHIRHHPQQRHGWGRISWDILLVSLLKHTTCCRFWNKNHKTKTSIYITLPELVYVTRKWKMVEHGRTMAAFAFHGNQSKQNRPLWHPLQDSTQSEWRWPGCAEPILKWTWHKTHKEIPSWGRAKHDSIIMQYIYIYIYPPAHLPGDVRATIL